MENGAAERVREWIAGGCPSGGAPVAEIRALVAQNKALREALEVAEKEAAALRSEEWLCVLCRASFGERLPEPAEVLPRPANSALTEMYKTKEFREDWAHTQREEILSLSAKNSDLWEALEKAYEQIAEMGRSMGAERGSVIALRAQNATLETQIAGLKLYLKSAHAGTEQLMEQVAILTKEKI